MTMPHWSTVLKSALYNDVKLKAFFELSKEVTYFDVDESICEVPDYNFTCRVIQYYI